MTKRMAISDTLVYSICTILPRKAEKMVYRTTNVGTLEGPGTDSGVSYYWLRFFLRERHACADMSRDVDS